jgi:Mce-associated membrane protein
MSAAADLIDAQVDDAPEIDDRIDEPRELDEQSAPSSRANWNRLLAFGVLPVLALILAAAAGFFKWQDSTAHLTQAAAGDSVRAASDSTVAILSYRPETVERELPAAAERLTGSFRDQYTQLINDVVIPGAKQQHIAAAATVPAAASVSAAPDHAVTLVLVDQTTTIGNGPPTKTTSSVRVTLDKVDGRWLVSQFEPV